MRCNDLLKDTAATTFPAVEEKLKTFMQNCQNFKREFMQKLKSLLPSIRGGGQESALADILEAYEKSPFNSKDLDHWLTQMEKESVTMTSFLKQLEKLGTELDGNLNDLLSDLDIKNIVSFTFTSIYQPDNSRMKKSKFLSTAGEMSESTEYNTHQNRNTEWPSADTIPSIRKQLQLFKQLKEQLKSSGDTKYIVECRYDKRYPGACIFIYEDESCEPVPFIPPSEPAIPTTSDVSYNRLTVRISDPDSATDYRVEFRERQGTEWKSHSVQKSQETVTLSGLKPDTEYEIRATAVGKLGYAVYSDALTVVTKAISPPTNGKVTDTETKTKKGPMDDSRFTPRPGIPPVYLLNKKQAASEINKMCFGEESSRNPSNKTIMLVGATGSGKTTLINGMINYILGVDWEDNWRFKLIDEETNKSQGHSQTSEVTAYQIHHSDEFQIPHSLTIIDTPGFGDTRGINQDREITEKMRQFFTNKDGLDSIDAVCFVVQSAFARLTKPQRYIIEAILAIFGKNISKNIITLVTFADAQSPPVLEAIKEANIPCATETDGTPVHLTFNNSVIFVNNTEGSNNKGNLNYTFWKMGQANMKSFFDQLHKMETQNLTLTKQVLEERKKLQAAVEGVQPLIGRGLSTMEEIRTTKGVLDKHKSQIEENKNFEYEVKVEHFEKVHIPSGTSAMNCHKCKYSCHYPCGNISLGYFEWHCDVMKNGQCTVCPGKCQWTDHKCEAYKWEVKCVMEKRTYQELKSKYEKAMEEKVNTEKIMAQLEQDYHQVQGKILEMMETVTNCLQRLKQIGLRPDPLSTPDYIALLIESEKQEARPGYKQRIRELEEVRERAVFLQKVALSGEETSKLKVMSSKAKAVSDYELF